MSMPFEKYFLKIFLVDSVGLEPTSNGLRVRYNKPLYDRSMLNLLSAFHHIHRKHYAQIMPAVLMIGKALLQITFLLLGYVTVIVSGWMP